MTQPRSSGPAAGLSFAGLLRGALVPMLATAPVIVLGFWFARQAGGALAALLGVVTAMVFFAGGLYLMARVTSSNPANQLTLLAGALAVYFGQVIFLAGIILALYDADWLDGTAFGLSVLAAALIWQLSQVVAFVRMRRPVYDEPAAEQPAQEPS